MKIIVYFSVALMSIFISFLKKGTTAIHNQLPPAACETLTGMAKIICLADEFKATLSSAQIVGLQLPYTLTDAQKWSNLPNSLGNVRRVGLQFNTLSTAQLTAAKNLLKAVTSTTVNEGFAELEAILAADDYLSVNGGGTTYGMGNFFMAFLGTPSMTGKWELQFGGHHYTFANTYNNGVLVGATPSFRSSEPSGLFMYNGASYQPMLQELAAFSSMLTGLSAAEQNTAKLSSTFTDLLLGPGKDWQFPTTRVGLKVGDLSADKKALVIAAIKTYVNDLEDATATAILNKYTAELDNTYIAFSGTTAMTTKNDYVRIDGPSIWLEYSMQGGIVIRTENHPHSVWRDRSGDYGGTGNPTPVSNTPNVVNSIKNYPNPATQTVNIDLNLSNYAEIAVALYDLNGKLVANAFEGSLPEGRHILPVDVSHLSNGSYFYQVKSNEKGVIKTLAKQIIKM
jgi:Protein of unknown function (DUF3500)/Secretion system C-terminal sorting domain